MGIEDLGKSRSIIAQMLRPLTNSREVPQIPRRAALRAADANGTLARLQGINPRIIYRGMRQELGSGRPCDGE